MSMKCKLFWWPTVVSLYLAFTLSGTEPPSDIQWNRWLQRADRLDREHRFSEAVESGKRALAVLPPSGDDRRQAITRLLLGNIYRNWGRCAEARSNYARAVTILEKQPNPEPKYIFAAINSSIGEAFECDDPRGAEKLYRAHSDELQRFRSGPLEEARILALRAHISRAHRRYADAANLLRQSLQIMEGIPGANRADTAALHETLSLVMRHLGREEEALSESRRALALFEAIDARNPSLVLSLNSTAMALFSLGRMEESAQVYRRAADLATEIFGEDSRFTAGVMMNYAFVLTKLRRWPEANAMNQRGRDAYRHAALTDSQTVGVQELAGGRR